MPVRDPDQVLHDAARLHLAHGRLAFTTDSYVVHPLEFEGGDIGSLAATGTANDLAMAGARPLHLSVGLILEEGLALETLRRIIASLGTAARRCGMTIVTGDTKVVERGKGDGVFINTSGIGLLVASPPIDPTEIRPGDHLLVSGDLGRHGVAILAARHGLDLQPPLASDCAPLWPRVRELLDRRHPTPLSSGPHPRRARQCPPGTGHGAGRRADRSRRSGSLWPRRWLAPANCWDSTPCIWPMKDASWRWWAISIWVRPWRCWNPRGGARIGVVAESGAGVPGRVLVRTPFGSERVLVPLSGELLPRIC